MSYLIIMINNLPKTFCHPKNSRKIIPIFKREAKRGSLVKVKVTQSCLTLCDPMDSTVHGILQAKILERISWIFPTQGSNPDLQNCRRILYQLSRQVVQW